MTEMFGLTARVIEIVYSRKLRTVTNTISGPTIVSYGPREPAKIILEVTSPEDQEEVNSLLAQLMGNEYTVSMTPTAPVLRPCPSNPSTCVPTMCNPRIVAEGDVFRVECNHGWKGPWRISEEKAINSWNGKV